MKWARCGREEGAGDLGAWRARACLQGQPPLRANRWLLCRDAIARSSDSFQKKPELRIVLENISSFINVSDLFRNSGKACGSQCEQLRGLALACGLLACRAWAGLFGFLLAG